MTDIEWGAEIAVNGVRPEWLTDAETSSIKWSVHTSPHDFVVSQNEVWKRFKNNDWEALHAIRLPATHPYYLATSRGFTYWPGGESAPADWDGGTVLLRGEQTVKPNNLFQWDWREPSHWNISGDIIGYRKSTERPEPAITPELVERMVALVRSMSEGQNLSHGREARAILAELEPDPDLILAKSIVGDAEAIALAIKAARENGR